MSTLAWKGRGALWLLAVIAGQASAATFTVTRFDDPTPNGCQVGDCSLREAVLAANAQLGSDLVVLGTGTYAVASTFLVRGELRILGSDPVGTRVLATSPLEPLLRIDDSIASTLYLEQLSIDAAGGTEVLGYRGPQVVADFVRAPNPDGRIDLYGGSGIFNVFDSDIAGAANFNDLRYVTIEDSRFAGLNIEHGPGVATNPIAYLRRVVIDGIDRSRGWMYIKWVGEVGLYDMTVQNTNGGLLVANYAPQVLTIDRLRYLDNGFPLYVGLGADVTITRSVFRGNRSLGASGPAALWVLNPSTGVVVRESTFANNTSKSNTGGAVLIEYGASLSLRNSTFVNNSLTVEAAGAGARGAAVGYLSHQADTALTLQNVIIVAPTFMPTGAEGSALGGRGAASGVTLTLYNSIFDGSCRSDGVTPEFAIGNIKTSGDNCGLGSGNLLGVSRAALALGPLGENGGPTPTMVPASTSVAIDGGNNFGCMNIDQRGIARPQGLRCDAGAIETGEFIFANGFN